MSRQLSDYIKAAQEAVEMVEIEKNRCESLYRPIEYILSGGGKRLRPMLLLLSCESCGGKIESAVKAAAGIEIFHNFTLVHDDVMDKSETRRGRSTIHKLWDDNTAILSGDTMLTLATLMMMQVEDKVLREVLYTFNKMAIEIYEGQALDVEFEGRQDVTLAEYLDMIRCKTSALLGAACKIGALIGGASAETSEYLFLFGEKLGLAFQIQDDYLDLYGDPVTFGKPIGGDIINDKKTFLRLSLSPENESKVREAMTIEDSQSRIDAVREIMTGAGIPGVCEQSIRRYSEEALSALSKAEISDEGRDVFVSLVNKLISREK